MDYVSNFKEAVFCNKKIEFTENGNLYGLVVEQEDGLTHVLHIAQVYKTSQKLAIGTWVSFQNTENPVFKIEKNQEKFPATDVYNNVLSVMSQAAAPNANYHLNPIGKKWQYLAWSTEWDVIGDPKLLFTRFSKEKIFDVRLVYRPGRQPLPPQVDYFWEIAEIFVCFDKLSQFQIMRAPWSIGRQQMELDEINRKIRSGFVYRLSRKFHYDRRKKEIQFERPVFYLATGTGQSIRCLSGSSRDTKLGNFVDFVRTIQLGTDKDTAFIKQITGSYPGQTENLKTDEEELTDYHIEFTILFDENVRETLSSPEFIVQHESFEIHVSTKLLNECLLRYNNSENGIETLQPFNKIFATAKFHFSSPQDCYIWSIVDVYSVA